MFSILSSFRALISLSAVVIVYYVDYFRITPVETLSHLKNATTTASSFSTSFYIILVTQFIVYAVFAHTMFVCQMAFHARVADPSIGGTYMTLLNTAANLGELFSSRHRDSSVWLLNSILKISILSICVFFLRTFVLLYATCDATMMAVLQVVSGKRRILRLEWMV